MPVSVAAVRAITSAPILAVHTKSDLALPVDAQAPGVQGLTLMRDSDAGIAGPVRVSAVTREGLVELMGCLDGVLEASERRHEDQSRRFFAPLRFAKERQAIHAIHDEVGEDDVHVLAGERVECGSAVRGLVDRPALLRELALQEAHHLRVIVDHQDPHAHDRRSQSPDGGVL